MFQLSAEKKAAKAKAVFDVWRHAAIKDSINK